MAIEFFSLYSQRYFIDLHEVRQQSFIPPTEAGAARGPGGKPWEGSQLCPSAVGQAFVPSLRLSLVEGHRRQTLWPAPKKWTTRKNMEGDCQRRWKLYKLWLTAKISLSNSLENTPATKRGFFSPNPLFKPCITVLFPHQLCSCHLPGLGSVSVLLYILMRSVYTTLSVWKPSSFRDKGH